jgi:hypothetical protein
MEKDCEEGQGLSWAVEPRREREIVIVNFNVLNLNLTLRFLYHPQFAGQRKWKTYV